LKAFSKSFGSSEAPTCFAISTKRLWRSASVSLGFDLGLDVIRYCIAHIGVVVLAICLVTLSPLVAPSKLVFAFGRSIAWGEDKSAESGFVDAFKNVAIFDITPKILLPAVHATESVWGQFAIYSGGYRQICNNRSDQIGWRGRQYIREFTAQIYDCSPCSSGIVDPQPDRNFHQISRSVNDCSGSLYEFQPDVSWTNRKISALQIEDSHFSNGNLFLRGFGRSLSGQGERLGVAYALTHVAKLPQEQTRLTDADDHEPKREEPSSVMRYPVPKGAMFYMSLVAVGALLGGIGLGWLATR
jgi:hypothetical protein